MAEREAEGDGLLEDEGLEDGLLEEEGLSDGLLEEDVALICASTPRAHSARSASKQCVRICREQSGWAS